MLCMVVVASPFSTTCPAPTPSHRGEFKCSTHSSKVLAPSMCAPVGASPQLAQRYQTLEHGAGSSRWRLTGLHALQQRPAAFMAVLCD